ncbi:mechanosensitive ion channel family protein [bacterium]|nr:mechanosensitive ion channel family protein [bacterium]MBT7772497.1 mechanosensitive ion channel family protein [bacterium]
METWQQFGGSEFLSVWNTSIGVYTVGKISIAMVLFCLIWAVIRAFRLVGLRHLQKWSDGTPYDFDNKILKWMAEISALFFGFLSLYIVSKFYLEISGSFEKFLDVGFVLLVIFESARVLQKFVDYGMDKTPLRKNVTTLRGTKRMIRLVIWAIALLMALANLGVNVTTLVASLGIGGIAIAFALQNILGDIFSSFSIYFDKPFQEGDYIIFGEKEGTIQQIGLKTTRILALRGEEIVVSNKTLTESCVNNFGKMEERRIQFTLSVAYDTPLKKLKMVDKIVKKSIENQKLCTFDRVFFKEIGNSSFEFDIVYFVKSGDYLDYAGVCEKINWEILEQFEKNKIKTALPTELIVKK